MVCVVGEGLGNGSGDTQAGPPVLATQGTLDPVRVIAGTARRTEHVIAEHLSRALVDHSDLRHVDMWGITQESASGAGAQRSRRRRQWPPGQASATPVD